MAIQVRCPNGECGKLLSVADQFGGKTGRCPSCGAVMPIPHAKREDVNVRAAPTSPPGAEREAIPVHRAPGGYREDDEERLSARKRPEVDDDQPYAGKKRLGGPPAAIIVILAIGTGLLVFLGLTPLFAMLMPTSGHIAPTGSYAGMIELTEGKVLMIGTLGVASVCLASLIVYLFAPAPVSSLVVTLTNCLAAGWSVMVMIWQLGFIWDIFMVIRWIKENRGDPDPGFLPGLGLWIGLGMSLVVVILFAILASLRSKGLWLYPAEGLGLIAGILLLTLNVRPWNPGPSREDVHGAVRSEAKLYSRYVKWLGGR